MKKIVLGLAFSFGMALGVQAQEGLELGVHLGFPTGDISKTHSFNFGVDAAYRVEVIDNLKVGGAIAFDHFVGKDVESNNVGTSKFANVSFLPVAASATYHFADPFYAGLDLGYAVSLSSDVDGGFYAQPKIGYDFDQFTFFGFFKNITSRHEYVFDNRNYVDKSSAGTIGIGAAYKF
ncbi:hypothetical protein ACF3NR_04230 [Vaginella massiliensis]|uniref:hypothetical protein n=1 Tax=Vaginella massiliensis TaxID=1816680 RepID=UPI00083873C9|nr:hypothetical protein [Vaginella massiliensis]